MSDSAQQREIRMDADNLWIEEVFTDRQVGTIQRLSPVTRDGKPDPKRSVSYSGQTQILTPAGALPLSFEIPAASLGEAVEKFGTAAEGAVEDAMQQIENMRREAASSLIVPGQGGGPMGGGMPGGGMPGGGLKLR